MKTNLTEEERNILILIAQHPGAKHLTNEEIGQRLGIPVGRVKTVIHQACLKLGADNRNEAVLFATNRGEIRLNEVLSLEELAELFSTLDPDALRAIANHVRHHPGQKPLPQVGEQLLRTRRRPAGILTNRERDVLVLVSRGLTNQEIADRLTMSTSAVRTFLNRAFTKLGARKRADAMQMALKQGEISVGEMSSPEELLNFLAPLGAETIEKIAQLLEAKPGLSPASTGR